MDIPPPPPILARAAVHALTEDGIAGHLIGDPTCGRLLPIHADAFCRSRIVWPDAAADFEDSTADGIRYTAAACPRTTIGWVLVTLASLPADTPFAWVGWSEYDNPADELRLPRLHNGPAELTAVLYHAPTLASPDPVVWRSTFEGPVQVIHPSTGEPVEVARSVRFHGHRPLAARIPFAVLNACAEQVSR